MSMSVVKGVRLGVALVVAAVGIVVTGCVKNQLRIVTKPTGSSIVVRDAKGRVTHTGTAPFNLGLSFDSGKQPYAVEAKPSSAMDDRYVFGKKSLSQEEYDALPKDEGANRRILEIDLAEKEYLIVKHVEVILDARRRWRGVVTQSRAYKDIKEAGGAIPGLIVEFGENLGIQSLALSPDGNRIVYSVAKYDRTAQELSKIVESATPTPLNVIGANLHGVDTRRGGIQHITSDNFRDMFPSFTTDGEYILFTSNRRRPDSEDLLEIHAVRREGIRDVYLDRRDGRVLRPTQAADGTIAYALEDANWNDEQHRNTVWTVKGKNGYPYQIQGGTQPAISPDGKHIAYIGGDRNLWVVEVDGSNATQITSGSSKIVQRYKDSLNVEERRRYDCFVEDMGVFERMPYSYPSWSSDGEWIVFSSMEGSDPTGRPNEDVWAMRSDGSGKRQLTTNGSTDRYPLLSPGNEWIYFMSNRGGRWAIWRIEPSLD